MVISVSKKLHNITIDVVFIMKYNSPHKKNAFCRNTRNLILIKHKNSTENSTHDTEKCAFIPHKLNNLHQLGYYIYSFCKSIQDFRSKLL
jgi:hypothetical protein